MSHPTDKGFEVAEPRERMSKWVGDFPLAEHLDAQRQDVQEATRREPNYFERHDGFVQPPLLFNQIGKAKDVPRAAGFREPIFERGPPQADNRFHRFDVFWTDFDTEVATRTVPDPMFVLERRESGSCR